MDQTMEMLVDVTMRLGVALLLGGAIGLEREYRSKVAGFRTHFLVAMGSALFCIVSQYGFDATLKDSSRVAAQVVSGIGFLGAGTIIFQKNVVRGLTTAAGLWVTAAIGLACGTGLFAAAAVATTMALIGLEVLHALIPHLGNARVMVTFTAHDKDSVKSMMNRLKGDGLDVSSYEIKDRRTPHGKSYDVLLEIMMRRGKHAKWLIDYMDDFDDVTISCGE